MSEIKYSLEEIKKAFWKEFHEAGEIYFGVMGSHDSVTEKKENIEITEGYWKDFVEVLEYNRLSK